MDSNSDSAASTLLTLALQDDSNPGEGTRAVVSKSQTNIGGEDDSKSPPDLKPESLPTIPRIPGKKTPEVVPKAKVGGAASVLAAVKGKGSVGTKRRNGSKDKKGAKDKRWKTIDKTASSKKPAKKRAGASSGTSEDNAAEVKGDFKKKSKRPKLPKAPSPLTEEIFEDDLEVELKRMEIRSDAKVANLNTRDLAMFSNKFRSITSEDQNPSPTKEEILDVDEMEKFVARSFAAWQWDTEDQFKQRLEEYANKRREQPNKTLKTFYLRMIQAVKKERRQARTRFEREYKFSKPALVRGIRYNKDKDQFTARVVFHVWSAEDQVPKEEIEYMQIEEQWFTDNDFDEEMVKHIIDFENDDGFVSVPTDLKPVMVNQHAISRVKYVPPGVREIIDVSKINRVKSEEILKERTRSKSRKDAPASTDSFAKDDKNGDEENEEIAIPTRKIPTNAHWIGKLANGETTPVTEEFVTNVFGEAYTAEMKLNIRGYVDVPVGDFKISHLHKHPNLRIIGAPTVAFVQSEGMDLCVPKALASVLHWLGFCEEAKKINAYGEQTMYGGTLNAMDKIRKYAAASVLPRWIQVSLMPVGFQWINLNERDILLAVLTAADGNQNHAVAIHGGYIYDANEVVAIPLCEESLNYCTSTSEKKSTFKEFRRGIFFSYTGQKKGRMAMMTLPSKRCKVA